MKKLDILEFIGDALLIAFGIIMIYVFLCIEVLGRYGVENNVIVRNFELYMGIPIILIGITRLIDDIMKALRR